MAQDDGGSSLASDPAPGSEKSANFTLEELLWVWEGSATDKASGQKPDIATARKQAHGSRYGGGMISAAQAERIRKIRAQQQQELAASNAAAAEQTPMARPGSTPSTPSASSKSTSRTATDVEQEMYTQFLGL